MAFRFLLCVIFLGLLATISQANLLGDAHRLKRYSRVYEVPPVSTHSANDVLSGNPNTTRTSIRSLLPASTLRMVDGTSLSSTSLFESTGLETETNANTYDHGTSRVLSQTAQSISEPVSDDKGISATSIEVDWTRLLPVTPTTRESSFERTRLLTRQNPAVTDLAPGITSDSGTSYDTGGSRATEPTTTDISLQITSTDNSDTSVALPRNSGTSRSGAESKELDTADETATLPSQTSQAFQDSASQPFTTLLDQTSGTGDSTTTTIQSDDELDSTSPPSEALTVSEGASRTLESSQPAMESRTTKLESTTTLTDSADSSPPSTTLEKTEPVTKSNHKSLTSEKTSEITNLPIVTGSVASSTMTSEDGIVTGTDGTVATYVPEQNKDYISPTGTTTTTDDNGAAIVIFPFGWFWKLHGGKGGGGVAKPPAPTANPVPENEPGDKNEGYDDNDDDDDASTKEDDRSTAHSTVLSTTQQPTSATTTITSEETTSDECTAATQPDCTKTISYMTSDGTQIMTEFGSCPTIISCATKTQTTETVTLTSEFIWAGVPNTNPAVLIPEDAYTADVGPEIVAALEAQWAEIFGDDDGWNDTETAIVSGSTTIEESTMTSLTDTEAVSTVTSEDPTTAYSNSLTSNTKATATFTTASDTYSVTTTPSTLITKTRGTSDTTDMPASTDEEATRTYFPCVIHGGPAVETPYCQCSTTISGEGYYATTSLVDDQCTAYTVFSSQITAAPETGPITDEPIQQPITTTIDGTVLVWSAYVLDYINIPGITKIIQSVGVGKPSTVSTPLPSQTAVDNGGGGQCGTGNSLSKRGLREACDRAINKFEDDTIYSEYASRYSRSTKGILVAASFGQAACIAKFQCDDYGIGMKGSDIKEARESAKENDSVDICGHTRG
ncbi:hypothetical protein FDENT_9167 [Fusarium denticulatum]|uniref:Uncharacterized protein n=1 Tax=Fusarium denticulatum TaxID=48507 RepID=A0A8H5TY31_9HYPO|nr:hypothetical protein FDENT_9167 [Fusarium denticulatum]